jgi:hypothetical protein
MSWSGGPPGPHDQFTPAQVPFPTNSGTTPFPVCRAVASARSSSGRHRLLLTVFHVEPSATALHGPVGPGGPARPRVGVVRRSPVPVTPVDWSTSCPQRCAQVGEISPRPLTRRHDPPSTPTSSPTPGDDGPRRPDLHVHPVRGGRTPATAVQWAHTWVRTGDGRWGNQGTGRGETAAHVRNRRDVHVSTQECPCPPTVGQHVDSGADLRERPRSPGSTPVMTEMRDIDQGFSNHIQGGDAALRVT